MLALGDGSTDATAEMLARSSLAKVVHSSPPRAGWAGWDDRANRQLPLDAAIDSGCDWALFVDEHIPEDDAAVLSEFTRNGADRDCVYLFQVFCMVGDESHYDQAGLWVARLFSPRPGHELPPEQLHLVPVPGGIPVERWRGTAIRIQHLGALTRQRRRERLRKYEQADPERCWQQDYRPLLAPVERPRRWRRRAAALPVLTPAAEPLSLKGGADRREEVPLISAIVISRDDEETIAHAVDAVVEQCCSFPFEVLVVCSGHDRSGAIVRERVPQVRLIELPRPALPGEARNAGLRAARGEFVTFPGSHIRLAPGSLEARVRAHLRGFDLVTDTVLNGTTTRSGWASYFLDHGGCLPGRPSGGLPGPPGHCSYRRRDLLELGGFPEAMRAGEDTVVNAALWNRGRTAYRASEVRIVHHSPCSGPLRLTHHHFQRGRAWARITRAEVAAGRGSRLRLLRMLATYGPYRLAATERRVRLWAGELRGRYRRVRPLVLWGIAAAWAGVWVGVLDPHRAE